jgi:hypothetical protein
MIRWILGAVLIGGWILFRMWLRASEAMQRPLVDDKHFTGLFKNDLDRK